MAQNIFAREESLEISGGGKLKKKKKKKAGLYRRKEGKGDDFGDESRKILEDESPRMAEDEFNPYNMDDPMDMPEYGSSAKAPSKTKRRTK
jgi:hypothetical protein